MNETALDHLFSHCLNYVHVLLFHIAVPIAPSTVFTPTPHVIANESSTAVLTCIGMGHPLPDIYWKRQDGQSLPERREIMTTNTTDNVTLEDQYIQSTLLLSNVTSTDDAVYVCTAINSVTLTLEQTTVLLTVQGTVYANIPLSIASGIFSLQFN